MGRGTLKYFSRLCCQNFISRAPTIPPATQANSVAVVVIVLKRSAILFILQLEEKTRRLRELESASISWEGRIRVLEKEKFELQNKVKQTREALDEHVARLSKQVI